MDFMRDTALALYTLSTYIGELFYCIYTVFICIRECIVDTTDL